jgi:hypothetical protein
MVNGIYYVNLIYTGNKYVRVLKPLRIFFRVHDFIRIHILFSISRLFPSNLYSADHIAQKCPCLVIEISGSLYFKGLMIVEMSGHGR